MTDSMLLIGLQAFFRENRRSGLLNVLFQSVLTTPVLTTTWAIGFCRHVVIDPFRFARMSAGGAAAIERCCVVQRDWFAWLDGFEHAGVRLSLQKAMSLVADGHSFAPRQYVPIVVFDFLEWAAIDQRLIAFQAWPLLAFIGQDRD